MRLPFGGQLAQAVEVPLDLVDDVAAGAGIVGGEEVGVALGVVGGGEAPGALPPDPRDLSHQASGPGRQPGGGLPVTLTVWPTFGAPVASQQSRILRKAGQILAQTAPATGIFQDRQRKVLNYPVVLRMGSGHGR